MKTAAINFITSSFLFSLFIVSCAGNSKEIKIVLIDSSLQNAFSDVQVLNRSTHKIANKSSNNIYSISAKVGDEISISSKSYVESVFKVNDLSEEYNIMLSKK